MKKLFSLILVLCLLSGCMSIDYIGEIQLFLPGEYISQDVIDNFEYEYKIKVNVTTFDTNESMYTKLLSGASFDIVIPSDYMIERLIEEDMVIKLDKSKISNYEYLYDGVLHMDFDYNNDYSIPYFWGNVGIVYDETLIDSNDVEKEGWNVLLNTKYKGMIYAYDSIRDIFMVALKQLGYSMNTTNEEELNKAYEWLVQIAKTMEPAYATDECIDGLAYGEKAMGIMYSGDAAYILSENEDMRFYVPDSGTNYWVDGMCILKNSKNVEYAYEFINYIIDYDAQFDNSSEIGYASVNKEVLNDLTMTDGDFEGNEAYLPKDKTSKDESFHNNEDTLKIMSELWSKVKIQGE